jgi:hypothetical protein
MSMIAHPKMTPRAIPRIEVGGSPLDDEATAAATAVVVVALCVAAAAVVEAPVAVAVADVVFDSDSLWTDCPTRSAVAFCQLFVAPSNMHKTSSSSPPDITTVPLESLASEYCDLVVSGAKVEL